MHKWPIISDPGGARTLDPLIKSQLLSPTLKARQSLRFQGLPAELRSLPTYLMTHS